MTPAWLTGNNVSTPAAAILSEQACQVMTMALRAAHGTYRLRVTSELRLERLRYRVYC